MTFVETAETATHMLNSLLSGTGLAGFSFATSYTLRVERTTTGRDLPQSLELRLDCTWWFGNRSAWKQRVAQQGPTDLAEPEEAIQAFDLVRLRWADGCQIDKVSFDGKMLNLLFANGTEIFASAAGPDESWELVESGRSFEEAVWSVRCEHGQVFAQRPF